MIQGILVYGPVLFLGMVVLWYRAALLYSARLHRWENERFALLMSLFAGFDSLTSKLGRSKFEIREWAKGQVVYHEGTALNYETLVAMVRAVQAQEAAREAVFEELRKQVGLVISYERTNPQPKRPTLFGWEFPLPV